MTKSSTFPPTAPLHVIVAYEGVQLLDVAGTAEVFATAATLDDRAACEVALISSQGGTVMSSAGVALQTRPPNWLAGRRIDTLIVAGGPVDAVEGALRDRPLRAWLRQQAAATRRLCSVCSGVFVLAAAGLATGRRVATHWSAADRLQAAFRELNVDREALFVRDGSLWTSGGVTTGIDMAIAMVAEDHGSALAEAVARQLVLSVRRPGGQSQYSPLLASEKPGGEAFADLMVWIRNNLAGRLDGPALAAAAGMSERTFQRRFTDAMGTTPAAFVERVRVDRARSLLGEDLPLKTIAARVGFSSSTRLAAAFGRVLGLSPQTYRAFHAAPGRPASD
jgi:transcriptional regulator GlxA family with amidase domain